MEPGAGPSRRSSSGRPAPSSSGPHSPGPPGAAGGDPGHQRLPAAGPGSCHAPGGPQGGRLRGQGGGCSRGVGGGSGRLLRGPGAGDRTGQVFCYKLMTVKTWVCGFLLSPHTCLQGTAGLAPGGCQWYLCGGDYVKIESRKKSDWALQRVDVQGGVCGVRSVAEKGPNVLSGHFTNLLL